METPIRLNTKLIKNLSKVLFMPAAEIIATTGMNRSTWYRIAESPHIITMQQLLLVANRLHIPARRFFSTGRTDVIGKREDYITEPYKECAYDADMLQRTVDARFDISWQQAANATGISRDNLRLSLLTITHTPVVRFLKACEAWGIDPFTILTDPNPEPQKEQKKGRRQDAQDLRAEIGVLKNDIRSLSETIADLTRKYEALLKEHADLERRVGGSHIGIAADERPEPEPDK